MQLTPATKDGGYDIFAISKDISGIRSSWIIECKKYSPEKKVGVGIVRALYGAAVEMRGVNALLATTSGFTRDARELVASRYNLALHDYQGVLEWINEYKPREEGGLYAKEGRLILPGKE